MEMNNEALLTMQQYGLCSTLQFPTDAHNVKKRRVIKAF